MRDITLHTAIEDLRISDEQRANFDQWLATELFEAKALRTSIESLWRTLLRQYEAVPETPIRNTPVENASNIEIPLGAIATDSIYAQMIDLIYTLSQPITVRHLNKEYVDRAKAMQTWIDVLIHDIDMRPASEHSIFDTAQLGNGFYYIPFIESYVKHKAFKVVERGPKIISMLPDDVFAVGGVFYDVQQCRTLALRFYRTESELKTYAKTKGWDISKCSPCAGLDWMTNRREHLARTPGDMRRRTDMYECYDIYTRYDIDGDGIDEDLLVAYDLTSQKSMRISYSPYDERPVTKMGYQLRSHQFYSQGVMEMLSPFQFEMTALHNHQIDNVFLSNCRMWASQYGSIQSGTVSIWAGRNLEMADPTTLKELKLSDIYPSLEATQGMVTSLAERRTGANELTQPSQNQTFGNRTPGVTAMSLLQQANRRFTPAFDSVRLGTAGAVRQAVLRYAERVRAGDFAVEEHLKQRLGQQVSELVIECLKDPGFDKSIAILVTASSQAINKDADRQNAVTLANTLAPYYEKMFQLTAQVVNPATPPELRSAALKIIHSTSELIDRIIRTFEQFKDPETFIVDTSEEILEAEQNAQLQQMMLQGMAMGGGMPGGGMDPGMMGGEGGGQPTPPFNGTPPPNPAEV